MNTVFELFLKTLMDAQKLRPQKSKWVNGELEWVLYERKAMLDAVNAERYCRGLPPVTSVDKAERSATGHIDYTRKFALYCSEMCNDNSSN